TGGAGTGDGTSCERMNVTLDRVNPTLFAGVIGFSSTDVDATSTVRGGTSAIGSGVAALLLLERVGCPSLQASGGGHNGNGNGVSIESSSQTNPGVIQADSAGIVGATAPVPCTTNENPSGYVIYGTALPAAGGGGASINAGTAGNGTPGVIAVYSVNLAGS